MIIYILKLENNKYYVGKTNNLKQRLQQHKNKEGAEWTNKYKVIELIKTINTECQFDEDKYVKIYMNKYGIDNVRGGSYNTLELTELQKALLESEFRTIKNVCYRCGRASHFVKNCYAKTDINGKLLNTNKTNNYNNLNYYNNELLNNIISSVKSIYRYFKY